MSEDFDIDRLEAMGAKVLIADEAAKVFKNEYNLDGAAPCNYPDTVAQKYIMDNGIEKFLAALSK